ncbi:hypothetical protein [Cytobacillus sp. IB215316]|uniref:hypothetical protein n=1 Tax=Cytobacillus sp. IB215316 TaxID=3097354 RepID=UPI002A0C5235|nr:hypothetical protein [Cytobacillus sp. IB215316]MDX8361640.1 hypothetical protein [Cytobacillus sp. IB215316]
MAKIRLATFNPLCFNSLGRKVLSDNKQLDPYRDGSIRPEPSFEHDYPGISSLCRKSKLAPKLNKGDIVIYLSKKGYYDKKIKHWKLVAVLLVEETMVSHEEAATWYTNNNFQLPKNIVVNRNAPLTFNLSNFNKKHAKMASIDYNSRASKYPQYNICEVVYRNTKNPPPIYEQDLFQIYERIPGTQNPCNSPKSNKKTTYTNLKLLVSLII